VGALAGASWSTAGLAAVAAVAGAYLLRESAGLPLPVPDRRRQVPDWWRSFFSPPVAAFLYGLGLGVGFMTFLGYGTFVAVAMAAAVSGDPLLGALLCAPFGIARGLTVMASRRAASAEQAAATVDRLERLAAGPLARTANVAALATVTGAAVLAAL
jgi:hypothetical protein